MNAAASAVDPVTDEQIAEKLAMHLSDEGQ
jgi:hypothetical protein